MDVCYTPAGEGSGGSARAALAAFSDPAFSHMALERTVLVAAPAPYRPGAFYLREMPALRAVLAGLAGVGLIVVDGYVDLDPGGRPGLGAYAHAEYGVPVVGVAKTAFRAATHAAAVLRGRSARPLYVTAAGMPLAEAADMVRGMAGAYRLPDALRRADALARGVAQPADPASDRDPAWRSCQ